MPHIIIIVLIKWLSHEVPLLLKCTLYMSISTMQREKYMKYESNITEFTSV
jgi:hypothetical protein